MFAILENIIRFHIESVIAALIALVCLLGGFAIYYSAFRKRDEADHEGDLQRIETAIEHLLQQGGLRRPSSATGAGSSGETAGIAEGDEALEGNMVDAVVDGAAEVELLSAELESKKREIESLKKTAQKDDKSAELLTKIKTLEDRLAEYEIIEDDIADLSKFKEENARLKRQLESVASGGSPASNKEIFSLEDEVTVSAAPAPMPAPAPAPASSAPAGPTDDLLAELTESPDAPAEEDPLAALGNIDTSKMLEEIQGLSDEAESLKLDDIPDVDKLSKETVKDDER